MIPAMVAHEQAQMKHLLYDDGGAFIQCTAEFEALARAKLDALCALVMRRAALFASSSSGGKGGGEITLYDVHCAWQTIQQDRRLDGL